MEYEDDALVPMYVSWFHHLYMVQIYFHISIFLKVYLYLDFETVIRFVGKDHEL